MKYSLFLILLLAAPSQAKTWVVGPTRQYAVPSAVANLVADGDTVLVDSGTYVGDVATWNNNNLVLRCPDGMARFNANGNIAGDKGIWLFYGKNAYVEGFEFHGAAISEADGDNGAGIRVQGDNFTCRRCYFHDNQEGILTGNDTSNNNIWIEACEFDHNGVETGGAAGFEHNIYVGLCSTCTIKFCYFHASIVGHEVKCRANVSYILYNYIVDGLTGDGSLSIDIPQGGLAFVIGNIIEKGPMTANSTVISYGEEGFKNPDTDFYFVNNTVVTDRNPTTFFNIASGTKTALIANNILAGNAHPIAGFDTESNVINTDTSFFHFADPGNYDYQLTEYFLGLQNAATLSSVGGFFLTPTSEYVNPEDSASRIFLNEIGAFALNLAIASSDSIETIKKFDSLVCPDYFDTTIIAIKNIGNVSVTYHFIIYGPDATAFTMVSQNPSLSISPLEIDTVLVSFSPSADGTDTADLIVSGVGYDTIPLAVPTGTAIVGGTGMVTVPIDSVKQFPMIICNIGNCSWTPGIPVVSAPFSYVSGGLEPIGTSECDTMIFAFAPTKGGEIESIVGFPNSKGCSIPVRNIALVGNAISAGVTQAGTSDNSQTVQNYPNPFTGETTIPLPKGIFGSLELFNKCGIKMDVTYSQTENGIVLERGDLPAGIYFYRISDAAKGTIAEGSVVIGN